MKFSPRKQTFSTVFFFARSSPPGVCVGRGVGARSEDKLLLATLNFGNVQGDEWVIQTRYLLACVASVSNRVTARKLEREQNRKRLSSFIPLPLPRHSFFFLLSSQLSRRTREEALATQPSYLRYIQAFWGWILSWQLCC